MDHYKWCICQVVCLLALTGLYAVLETAQLANFSPSIYPPSLAGTLAVR